MKQYIDAGACTAGISERELRWHAVLMAVITATTAAMAVYMYLFTREHRTALIPEWVWLVVGAVSTAFSGAFVHLFVGFSRNRAAVLRTGARTLVVLIAAVLVAACGHNKLTDPDGGEVRLVSALGFRIEATQEYLDHDGQVVQAHADLADRWWTSLMADLRTAKYTASQTDPSKYTQYTFVYLYKPIGADSSITCPGWSVLVGGCYDQFKPAYRVPGDYTDPDGWLGARPTAQPLKHEMTHHWCLKTLGHLCMTGDEHKFTMPNGRSIWEVQWYDAYPPAAAATMATSMSHARCELGGMQ